MPSTKKEAFNKKISDVVGSITTQFNPEKIILFGSHSDGTNTKDSDIDLCIIIDSKTSSFDLSIEISSKVPHKIPLDIIVKSPKEIKQRIKSGDFFIKHIMDNGKVLYEKNR